MRVEQDNLYTLLKKQEIVFKIPIFQRPYVWNENVHVKTLLDDMEHLLNNPNELHFLGTIVYMEKTDENSDFTDYLIIDGQQRITTLYILIKALIDSLEEKNDDSYKQSLEDSVIKNPIIEIRGKNIDSSNTSILRLELTPKDNEDLVNLINFPDRINKNSHIYKSYNIIKNRIKLWLESGNSPYLIEKTLRRLYYVQIKLEDNDDAQKIFASLNSTGKELNSSDLIRNLFLLDEDNMEYLYSNYWEKIEELLDRDKDDGTVLDTFLKHFLEALTGRFTNKKDIYFKFSQLIENGKDRVELLQDVYRKAKIYNAFIHPNHSIFSPRIKELLNYFKMINIKTVYPLLLNIFTDRDKNLISDQTLEKTLLLILSYLVRKQINNSSTKGFNKFFAPFYKNTFKNKEIEDSNYYDLIKNTFLKEKGKNTSFPNDIETMANLEGLNLYGISTLRRPLLIALENSGNEKIDYSNLTVEHIMPQTMTKEWSNMIKVSEDEYKLLLHVLGNLTLISQHNNSSLSNKEYKNKKKLIVSEAKATILNKEIIENDSWNIDIIKERTKRLSKLVTKVFPSLEDNTDVPKEEIKVKEKSKIAQPVEELKVFLTHKRKDLNSSIEASGIISSNGLLVLRGSKISSLVDPGISNEVKKLHDTVEIKNNILQEDVLFETPSGAAQFVIGKSANGWTRWRTKEGELLEDFREIFDKRYKE